MIIVVFRNETDAFKGLDGLKELHAEGQLLFTRQQSP